MALVFLEPARLAALAQSVNADPEFRLAARAMRYDVHLRADAAGTTFRIEDGQVTDARFAPFLQASDFTISGTADAWAKLLQPTPPPFYHHLYAAMFRRNLYFDGNLEAAFSSLDALSRMVDLMRQAQNPAGGAHVPA
ncbi:MAG: hypothetical protein EPN72_00915 [Nevskiaceae bacterium]|nr:MAG: hypothetical protein EPN63_11665 [Nevskiaceae bacterium]TBR74619.1 MAG: hypothetical protein EPN72_00915 [Nevskiaceae bacterium]